MKLIVLSDTQLDKETENKIRGILEQSSCANESFKMTFENARFNPRANTLILNDGTIETVLEDIRVKE